MINPNICGPENRYTIPIASCAEAIVAGRVPDQATIANLNIMNVEAMDDDIMHKLQSQASTIGNVHIGSTGINGFITGHDQLLI